MKLHTASFHRPASRDQALRWTMRLIGGLLLLSCAFFMTHEIFQGSSLTWFFRAGAGLGLVTLISSWLPAPKQAQLQEHPVITSPRTQ